MASRATALLCLTMLTLLPAAARAAASADPDWPCIQRLVPRIAAAQVLGGPETKPADWPGALAVSPLSSRLAVRATPIQETEALVAAFSVASPRQPAYALLPALLARPLVPSTRHSPSTPPATTCLSP